MSPDLFIAKHLNQARVDEALRKAERARWLREAGIHRSGWLGRQYRWRLCQLGRLLVSLGQSLQQRCPVPALTLEERVACGSQ